MLEKHILSHRSKNDPHLSATPGRGFVDPEHVSKPSSVPWIKWLIVVMLCCLLVAVAVIATLRLPHLQIADVRVVGLTTVDSVAVTETAYKYLHTLHRGRVPAGNAITFRPETMARFVGSQYPEFKNIRVYFSRPLEITIEADEYIPAYIWCSLDNDCYVADNHGYIYDHAPHYSPGAYVVLQGRLQNPDAPIIRNNVFADISAQKTLDEIIKMVQSYGFVVTGIDHVNDRAITLSVNRLGDKSFARDVLIRMMLHDQSDYIHTVLRLVLDDPLFKNTLQGRSTLEYIDIQFTDKIFYKFSQDSGPQTFVPTEPAPAQ